MNIFTFGKYKGQKVDDIIQSNPLYIDWCCKNVKGFDLTPQQTKDYNERMQCMYLSNSPSDYSKFDDFENDFRCY